MGKNNKHEKIEESSLISDLEKVFKEDAEKKEKSEDVSWISDLEKIFNEDAEKIEEASWMDDLEKTLNEEVGKANDDCLKKDKVLSVALDDLIATLHDPKLVELEDKDVPKTDMKANEVSETLKTEKQKEDIVTKETPVVAKEVETPKILLVTKEEIQYLKERNRKAQKRIKELKTQRSELLKQRDLLTKYINLAIKTKANEDEATAMSNETRTLRDEVEGLSKQKVKIDASMGRFHI